MKAPAGPPRGGRIRSWIGRPALLDRLRRLRRLEKRVLSPIVYGNQLRFLAGGRPYFEAVDEALDAATSSIAIEMYTWADDRLGRRIADTCRRAATRGVSVHILLDAFGSLGSAGLAASLERAGAEVRWYHPLAPWTPRWYPNRRNHRKVFIVDGARAFTGGMNLAETYSEEFRRAAAWLDVGVEIRGPAVRELVRLFVGPWCRAGGAPEVAGLLSVSPALEGRAGVQVVGGMGWRGRRRIRRSYLTLISQARQRILLANAYFAPEGFLRRALRNAARRGIHVRLLLPGTSDAPLVRWAGRADYGALLDVGVEIRETRRTVLHAKVAVFDDDVMLTGSANLDSRSFRLNLEVGVTLFEQDASKAGLAWFEAAWEEAEPVLLDAWKRRPVSERLLEAFARLWRPWL